MNARSLVLFPLVVFLACSTPRDTAVPAAPPEVVAIQVSPRGSGTTEEEDAPVREEAMLAAKNNVPAARHSSPSYQQGLDIEERGNQATSAGLFDVATTRFQEATVFFEQTTVTPSHEKASPELLDTIQHYAQDVQTFLVQEDVTGMKAMLHGDWQDFFDTASDIKATLHSETPEVDGPHATVTVRLTLHYQRAGEQTEETTAYLWLFALQNDAWMLTRVSRN